MKLTSMQLVAFRAVAKYRNFSRAAIELHITQSALSRRVKGIEDDLEVSLFVRTPRGAELTEEGVRLLKYVQTIDLLEDELFFDFSRKSEEDIGGMVKIGGYSSIMHPVAVPALAAFLRNYPNIQITFAIKDITDVPALLMSGEVDFIVTEIPIERTHIEKHLLAHEEYVAIESTTFDSRNDIYLDTSPADLTTEQFFSKQHKTTPKYRRSFMHDEAGVLIGVELGLGRAIKSRHMIAKDSQVRILKGYKPLRKPIYLQYRSQPYYTKLQQMVKEALIEEFPRILESKNRMLALKG